MSVRITASVQYDRLLQLINSVKLPVVVDSVIQTI